MKTVRFFLGALALAAVSAFVAPAADAAEKENRDENGNIVRGPYLTNTWKDHWFISGAIGYNGFSDNGYTSGFGLEANVGRWFTPEIGVRAGISGITGYSGNFLYTHIDGIWNFTNTFWGYDSKRFWEPSLYAHFGWFCDPSYVGDEIGAGIGLYNMFDIVKKWERTHFIVDARGTMFHGNGKAGYFSVNFGINVDLGNYKWVRACDYHNPVDTDKISAAEAAAAALTAANAALAAENAKLAEELAAAKAKSESLVQEVKKANEESGLKNVSPASFFFEIGQTKLSEKELRHLDFYLTNVLPNVKDGKATVVTGTADSNTGYAKRNEYLSKKRAEYIIDLLSSKYGIDTGNIVVKNQTVKAKSGKAAFDRAVVISFE